MPTADDLLMFAATSFVLIAIPGPSVLFTISRALTIGRRGALLNVAGNTVGECFQVVAVAVGLGVLVERSIAAFTIIKLVGVAYLVFLGIQAIRNRYSLNETFVGNAAP